MTLRFAATLGMLVLLASCAGPAGHAATPEPTPGAAEAHWIELDAFEKSVPPAPITVVFDIDDTALYSSHAMLLAEGAFHLQHPEVAKPYDDCRLFGAVNDSLDAKYSRVKQVAKRLVAFHVARHDRIVFITKRCASTPPNDSTSAVLARKFGLAAPPQVVFTNLAKKVEAFRTVKPAISYGDSDSDIEDTMTASKAMPDAPIRAVRIVRSTFSSNLFGSTPGKFGEDVIVGSDL